MQTHLGDGECHIRRRGDYERAIADYNQALHLLPNADLYHDRGIAYLRRGVYLAAMKDGFTFRWLKNRLVSIIQLQPPWPWAEARDISAAFPLSPAISFATVPRPARSGLCLVAHCRQA